ncbi:MAG: iron-responsive transcriptional regulator RirA [Methyloligellaceae bacterium]
MRLTRQTSYTVRILMYCAANSEEFSKVSAISSVYNIPEPYLFKILKPLVNAGYVETVRGRNGGIRLARPKSEIILGDVIKLSEENFILAECFESGETDCPLVSDCKLNRALNNALDAFFEVLNSYTIEDLSAGNSNINMLFDLSMPQAN